MTTKNLSSKFSVHIQPIGKGGFTQIPNIVLLHKDISIGAKMTYALLLNFAWHPNDHQINYDTLAKDMNIPLQDLKTYLSELQTAEYISVTDK